MESWRLVLISRHASAGRCGGEERGGGEEGKGGSVLQNPGPALFPLMYGWTREEV